MTVLPMLLSVSLTNPNAGSIGRMQKNITVAERLRRGNQRVFSNAGRLVPSTETSKGANHSLRSSTQGKRLARIEPNYLEAKKGERQRESEVWTLCLARDEG